MKEKGYKSRKMKTDEKQIKEKTINGDKNMERNRKIGKKMQKKKCEN